MFRAWNPWRDLVYDGATLSLFGFESVIFNEASRLELDGLNVNRDPLFREALQSLNKALNPPIKVTQAVLDAMEKVPEAKFRKVINDCRNEYTYNCSYSTMHGGWYTYHPIPKSLKIGDYIQADCPLALQVLLGFTVEGVPKDV
jgi:hypothetical protein